MKCFFVSLFCLAGVLAHSQLITDSVLIEGHYRSFHFNKPAGDITGGSLLFLLHGSGGAGKNILQRTAALEARSAAEKLLVVYPNGYKNYWNECRKYATSEANQQNINDNAFFEAMIGYFKTKYHIDENRVAAAGFSGGGHMAYKLAMTMPHRIHAIAAIVANLPDSASNDCTAAGKAVPVLIINGTLDATNPYEGGEMFVNNASYGVVRSSKNTFRYWAQLAGYNGQPVKRSLPDTDPADGKTIESYSYSAPGQPEVRLLKVNGGKHDYPGDINVYLYAWEFLNVQLSRAAISRRDPSQPVQVVETACGMCQLGLTGADCALAVRSGGKAYYVDGTDIDAHGDAHAKDGFCNAIRKAEVQGKVVNGRFAVTYFKLMQ
ncbi:MAG: DUF6370 family protein [Chitinophagaceae bacterium]